MQPFHRIGSLAIPPISTSSTRNSFEPALIRHGLYSFAILLAAIAAEAGEKISELAHKSSELQSAGGIVKRGRIPLLLIRNTLIPTALLMAMLAGMVRTAAAQSPSLFANDTEIWNDDVANVGLSKVHHLPKSDLQLTLSLRSRFDAYHLIRLGAGYAFTKKHEIGPATFKMQLIPHYDYYLSSNTSLTMQHEDRLSGDITPSVSFKCWTFTDRNRGEYRLVQGPHAWRDRNRFEIKHPAPWELTAFASYEFFHSMPGRKPNDWHQARLIAGAARDVSNNLGIQIYYLRQWHAASPPGNVNVVGFTLNVCFRETKCRSYDGCS